MVRQSASAHLVGRVELAYLGHTYGSITSRTEDWGYLGYDLYKWNGKTENVGNELVGLPIYSTEKGEIIHDTSEVEIREGEGIFDGIKRVFEWIKQ